eukprot:scaffold877_cov314-Pavlova_lutheri.AAC.4
MDPRTSVVPRIDPLLPFPRRDRTGWETGSIDRSIERDPVSSPPFPSSLPRVGEGGIESDNIPPPHPPPTTDVDMAPKKKDAPKEEAPVLGRFSSHLKVRNHVRPIPENQGKKIVE